MNMLKNKKGIFLPLFVFITIFILLTLFYVIQKAESQKNDLVGLQAVTIIKLQDETEKIQTFLDLAAEYASKNTLNTLAENGGYAKERCQKTQKDLIEKEEYPLIYTCPVLDIKEEFNSHFKKELKDYINQYESSYKKTELKEGLTMEALQAFGIIPKTQKTKIDDVYNYIYTEEVRKTNVINIESKEVLTISFSDIVLPIENAGGLSELTLTPKIQIKNPDLLIYNQIYTLIRANCVDQEFNLCQLKIKEAFPDSEILNADNLIKMKIKTQIGNIKIAMSKDKQIPIIV